MKSRLNYATLVERIDKRTSILYKHTQALPRKCPTNPAAPNNCGGEYNKSVFCERCVRRVSRESIGGGGGGGGGGADAFTLPW
ncbi:hypothetical protein E2C01_083631 [Portunus trituberculatus]|uniref:Uncharacterized protein n=1 Tax=Portunus trituberculatus TaxID=210409 RepID=A0A5B7IXP6_PORTR|nr:hypothetical protein [Portunus trituberculatus]